MPQDKNSAVDEFLGDLKNSDGDGVFEGDKKEELFAGDNIEGEQEKGQEDAGEDKPVAFHKLRNDPKFLRFLDKEISKRTPRTPEKEERNESQNSSTDKINDVLIRIIGNDTPEKVSAIRDLREVLLEREELGAQKAIREIDSRQDAENQAVREAQEELETGFDDIESTFNVDLTSNSAQAKKTRTEFINFMERIAPKDGDGEIASFPDFEETFRLFQETKKTQPNVRAREVASRGMTRTADASNTPTPRDYSWKGVERFLSGKK